MKKKVDRNVGFLLTFLLIVAILLIYANLSFNPTGFVTQMESYTNESSCEADNYVWYEGVCYDEQPECSADFLELCDETNCETEGEGYWYDDVCNEEAEPSCSSDFLELCDETNCETEGEGYWYDDVCNEEPECGNNEVEANEECEGNSTQGCTTTEGYIGIQNCLDCSWEECITDESCGDGIINGNEECDDGNGIDDDECFNSCILTVCGDGLINRDEVCDDGNTVTEECSYGESSCTVCDSSCNEVDGETSYCGDGECDNEEEACDSCEDDCGECEEEEEETSSSSSSSESSSSESSSSEESSGVTGSTIKQTCIPNWECGEWRECTGGTQDRVCTDTNQCDSNEGIPETSKTCIVEIKETCFDGIKNQDEAGIDCGGPCEKKCGFFTIVGSAISAPIDAGKNFVLKGMFGNVTKTIISIASLVLVAGGVVVAVLFKKKILKFPFPSLFKKTTPKVENKNL